MHIWPRVVIARLSGIRKRASVRFLISLTLVGMLILPGCLFRRNKVPDATTFPAPARLVFLPMNVPQANEDLHWISIATTVISANAALAAPDLGPVPLWESLPTALQSLENSRTVTPDIAELVAGRLSARWATQGEVSTAGNAFQLRLDFIPSRPTLVPFRYEKGVSAETMQPRIQEAFEQFLRYLIVRPMAERGVMPLDLNKLKEIAQAIDVEYGWFVSAKPGAAGKTVEDLAKTNLALAKLLFSPTLYPILGDGPR